jgi:hypothetical protein
MSQVCNTLAASLSAEALRDKKRLASDAGLELLSAASEVFKAAELSEHGDNPGSVEVYMSSACARLRQVSKLLGEVATILRSGTTLPEARDWHRRLDYERLYQDGLTSGEIPAGRELWEANVAVLRDEGPLASCEAFIVRAERAVTLAASGSTPVIVQSAVMELASYARYIGYINDLEPFDESKVREPAKVTTA